MPVNEFEKQVQDELGGFRLNPSASVWENVEKDIRERKRRRILIFFLVPLALGLLTFSGYKFFYSSNNNDTLPQTVAEKKTPMATEDNLSNQPVDASPLPDQPTSNTAVAASPIDNNAPQKNDNAINDDKIRSNTNVVRANSGTAEQPSTAAIDRARKNQQAPAKNTNRKTDRNSDLQASVEPAKKRKVNDHDKSADAEVSSVADDATASQNPTVSDVQDNSLISKPATTVAPQIDVTGKPATAQQTDDAETEQADTPVDTLLAASTEEADKPSTPPAKKKQQWPQFRWGVEGSGGVAFNNSGTLTFSRADAFDRLYNNGYGNIPGVGTTAAPVAEPSPIRHGAAFRLGLTGELQVSPKSRISVGLQYAYSSNRIRVGAPKDTTAVLQGNANVTSRPVELRTVYEGNRREKMDYTNAYHFVRVPVYYHWQINRGSKVGLQWNGGVSVDYLVSTSALLYSAAWGGIYYHDKQAFNKVHVTLGTGFSLRFKSRNGSEWLAGPEMSLDMNSLVKSLENQYMMYTGMQVKWLLPKKNK